MDFSELVDWVRGQCRVRVYSKRPTIYGGCRAIFHVTEHGPIICIATKGVPRYKKVEALLHEYGHYLQHADGFMGAIDGVCDSYTLADKWFAGQIEFTPLELAIVRKSMLLIEYDAERRGYSTGCELQPKDWKPRKYLQGAEAYMEGIKWTFARRVQTNETPRRREYVGRLLNNEELFAPLSDKRLKELDVKLKLRARLGQCP